MLSLCLVAVTYFHLGVVLAEEGNKGRVLEPIYGGIKIAATPVVGLALLCVPLISSCASGFWE